MACTLVFVVLGCGTGRRTQTPPAAGPRPASASPAEDACERGDNESCARAADALNGANATDEQEPRRFRLLKLGCDRGHEPCCLELAAAYGDGRGVKQDTAVSVALKRASCERGYQQGCAAWGLALLRGHGDTHDVSAAAAVCFDGPVKTRAYWCHLLGSSIDADMAEADLPMLARLYAHACSADFGPGCSSHGEILFRQGKRLEGIALLRAKCEQGLEDSCGMLEGLLALVAMEERDGGGRLGTPPAPLHLRLSEHGLSYDPPDENWGTSPPTHPGLRHATTRWRWWRRDGKLIEVVVLEGLPKGNAAIVATMPEVGAERLAGGAPVTKTSGVLGGKPCSHASFAMGAMGRGDLFMLASGDVIYSLLVLQQGIFSERLLERAVAGFHLDPR